MSHIKNAKNSNRPDLLHTKPTTQPINTAGIKPTVAAGRKRAITPTRTHIVTPHQPGKKIQKEHNNNHHKTTHVHHTTTSPTTQKNYKEKTNNVDSRSAIRIEAESPSHTKIQERRTPNTTWQLG
jgi:hypothetical protein